jgi:formate C-acetyltransferase
LDEYSGGARYSSNGYSPVGTIDIADSMASIKKLVFDEKKITIAELKKALEANFEGYDEIHRMCIEVPKYGNEDEYVDSIAQALYLAYAEEHLKHDDWLGRRSKVNAVSVTFHQALGARCGALPCGRMAGEAFANGSVSAESGMDRNGPTALIHSAVKVMDNIKYGGSLLNMKFTPSILKTREGLRKLLALIKTYLDLGGHHIQFNVVSSDTLVDAQLHPQNYRDLIVRVAGFSAYFIHLSPGVQDEIIERTELSM